MTELDNLDLEILRQLQEDSNLTNKQLAERVHLSPTPVYERVKKLEKAGYIKKYVALLDAKKLDKRLIVFCNITLKQHSRDIGNQFVKDITSVPEVTECYNVAGDYDFMLKVMVRDMDHYQDFVLNALGEIKNIGSAHSTFVMGEIKHTTGVPI